MGSRAAASARFPNPNERSATNTDVGATLDHTVLGTGYTAEIDPKSLTSVPAY